MGMNPQKRTVYLMLFIIVVFHVVVIPLWIMNKIRFREKFNTLFSTLLKS